MARLLCAGRAPEWHLLTQALAQRFFVALLFWHLWEPGSVPTRVSLQVLWLEQQVAKRRAKRDAFLEPTDPKFPQQWYLVGEAAALGRWDLSSLKPRGGRPGAEGSV